MLFKEKYSKTQRIESSFFGTEKRGGGGGFKELPIFVTMQNFSAFKVTCMCITLVKIKTKFLKTTLTSVAQWVGHRPPKRNAAWDCGQVPVGGVLEATDSCFSRALTPSLPSVKIITIKKLKNKIQISA